MTAASALPGERTRPLTAPDIAGAKGSQTPLVMVTAYDAPSARVVDAAGVDMILVGDTLAMVVLGYDDTLQVSTDDMAHHIGAVARTRPRALVVGDLPWMSYHVSREETVRNAAQLIRAGAGAIKLEGGRKRLDAISAILDAEIPVMGHLGLTPQSIHAIGGFKVQGKQLDAARRIVDDAMALAEAGCFAIVLECVPDGVARMVTDAVGVPTIGIGAGRHCDGQVLVYHDLLNTKKTADQVQAALAAADDYVAARAPELFRLVLEHLREVGEARSSTDFWKDSYRSRSGSDKHLTLIRWHRCNALRYSPA